MAQLGVPQLPHLLQRRQVSIGVVQGAEHGLERAFSCVSGKDGHAWQKGCVIWKGEDQFIVGVPFHAVVMDTKVVVKDLIGEVLNGSVGTHDFLGLEDGHQCSLGADESAWKVLGKVHFDLKLVGCSIILDDL